MNILAENSEFNIIEDLTAWVIIWKENGKEFRRFSKIEDPLYPIAAIAKWGYSPVNHERLDEIMQSDKTSNSLK